MLLRCGGGFGALALASLYAHAGVRGPGRRGAGRRSIPATRLGPLQSAGAQATSLSGPRPGA